VNDQAPLPYSVAARAQAECIAAAASLLARGRVGLPSSHRGTTLQFGDGTSAPVYRETVLRGAVASDPCVLIVSFRLLVVRGWGHRIFRWESLLNTPLFVGFPGFVSKLWLAHDQRDAYRGLYEWDGAGSAEQYARSLWRVLTLVSVPSSIRYVVLPGLRRDALLAAPALADETDPPATEAWWRLVGVVPRPRR
jgi:hypothetical protein